jgi:hypothetical protein
MRPVIAFSTLGQHLTKHIFKRQEKEFGDYISLRKAEPNKIK